MKFKEWFLNEVSFKNIHALATKANLDIFPFDKEELLKGYETESEHAGKMGKDTDVIGKDKSKILKIEKLKNKKRKKKLLIKKRNGY